MNITAPEALGTCRARLGETPVWCARSQSLLWVDILAQRLLRYWPDEQRTDVHAMPRFTSAVLLTREPERFLTVSQSGIALYHAGCRRVETLCDYPADAIGTRPNEAAIAPDGALWFSTMDPAAQQPLGGWYRVSVERPVADCLLRGLWVPNTLHWVDGHIWFADSLRQRFYRASFHDSRLHIHQHYPVAGTPDGSALTLDNQLINARWGDGSLVRYRLCDTGMHLLDAIPLPVRQPSSCTFGGPQLSDLYITSARDGLTRPGALDGALLRITTPFTGSPAREFRL